MQLLTVSILHNDVLIQMLKILQLELLMMIDLVYIMDVKDLLVQVVLQQNLQNCVKQVQMQNVEHLPLLHVVMEQLQQR